MAMRCYVAVSLLRRSHITTADIKSGSIKSEKSERRILRRFSNLEIKNAFRRIVTSVVKRTNASNASNNPKLLGSIRVEQNVENEIGRVARRGQHASTLARFVHGTVIRRPCHELGLE